MMHSGDTEVRGLRIAFYVTGHGFGHSTRATVIITKLLTLGHSVHIITSAPRFIFASLFNAYPSTCFFRSISTLDPGVVQKDPVTVDADETMERLRSFLEGAGDVMRGEEEWMRGKVDVVCLDAAFLPAVVAKSLGIPSLVISNFTFDAIFEGIARTPKEKALARQCRDMYAASQCLVRLPGYIHFPAFEDCPALLSSPLTPPSPSHTRSVIDVPLVVRRHLCPRDQVRSDLNIPLTSPCALITFGGFELVGPGKAWTSDLLPEGWYGIIAGPYGEGEAQSRLRWIPAEQHYMPDLINAVDVVVGKCGYGTCSEVVAHGVPLVYVPRPKFVEEQGLISNLMEPYGWAVEMPQREFYEGRWKGFILEAARKKKEGRRGEEVRRIGLDGDVKAAEVIVRIAMEGLSA
ncbi:hypothetical protein HK104_011135 [Borealophlyctis nickersoniae]|nr:hypothetical protein HK104_011135 [Borealophlyctis nickersoniae]